MAALPKMLGHQFFEFFNVSAFKYVNFFPIFVYMECRHAADLTCLSSFTVFIDVDFHKFDGRELGSQELQLWSDKECFEISCRLFG